jgi:hypothetical protein
MVLFFAFIVEIQVSSKQEVVDALVKEQFSVDVARVWLNTICSLRRHFKQLYFVLSNETTGIPFLLVGSLFQWVATNLRRSSPLGQQSSTSFSWTFDLNGISEMYKSYEDTNLW